MNKHNDGNDTSDNSKKPNEIHCSFCGRISGDVDQLISGHDAFICDECVELCCKVLGEAHPEEDNTSSTLQPPLLADNIKQYTPEKINHMLNDYVIGQDYAKKSLSVAVYNHYKKLAHKELQTSSGASCEANSLAEVELGKSNVLLIGPTGSGKTLLAETLARMLHVPFAIADATTLTEAGYVGEDVENIIQKLLQNCDYDVKKAEMGIIYIDEIDKIARKGDTPSLARDVSGEGVQQALLKIIEGTVANIPPPSGRKYTHQEYIQVNTSNILFICGGAFDGLEKIVQARTEQAGIGFAATIKSKDKRKIIDELLRQTEPEDLIKFGLIPEFVGRLPVIATLNELDEESLVRVLKEPKNSLTKQYQKLFSIDGATLEFTDTALQAIAQKALLKKSGARGLRSILEHALLDTMYKLPSIDNLEKVIINDEMIKNSTPPQITYTTKKEHKKTTAIGAKKKLKAKS